MMQKVSSVYSLQNHRNQVLKKGDWRDDVSECNQKGVNCQQSHVHNNHTQEILHNHFIMLFILPYSWPCFLPSADGCGSAKTKTSL